MNQIKDGGPAFPTDCFNLSGFGGLSKREWFAGMVLSGLNANPDLSAYAKGIGGTPDEVRKSYVASAYKQADLMLKEGEKS